MGVHLLRTGLETLARAEAHFRAFDGPGSHYDLCLFTHHDHSMDFGRKIARQNAVSKMWPLLGYELKCRLAQ